MPSLAEDVGRRIRELREDAGYKTQGELADLVGVWASAIGQLERGENKATSYELLDKIAHVLNVEPADLFNFPWSRRSIPWRHIAREQIRLTRVEDLQKVVERLKVFATVSLTELVDRAVSASERFRR